MTTTTPSKYTTPDMFTGLIDHAGINIILADPQGIITHYNPVAQKFYGYPPASIIGQSLVSLLPAYNRRRTKPNTAYKTAKL
jgi:PAS domain S-box-containing protein